MAEPAKGWRSRGSPLFLEDSYLGSARVLDGRQALHLPCSVVALAVEGNERTGRALIEREMQAALQAKTHADLAARLVNANARLHDLDVFRSATCHVDAAEGDDEVTVRVVVEEKGRHTVSTSTFVQEGEGCLEVAWSLRNFADNAEQLRGAVSGGVNQSSGVRLDFVRPYFMGNHALHAGLTQTSKHVPRPKSLREIQQGFSVTLEQRDGPHAFGYELCSRRLDGANAMPVGDVDDAVGNDTGDWSPTDLASLKSAVKHVFTHDTRDSKVVASSGCFVKSVTEAAGILGRGADFARNETQAQFHAPAGAGCTVSLWGSFGFLQPLRGDVSRYFDRFFLGGPLNLRGFRSRGLGPVVGAIDEVRPAKGGEAMMMMAAAVSRPLPLPPNLKQLVDARIQLFANVGNNISVPSGTSVASSVLPLLSGARSAVGVGIILPTALGRLEISLTKPIHYMPGDRTARWGVGLIPE